MEKFVVRARAQICTYHHLEQQLAAANQNSDNGDKMEQTSNQQELSYPQIERLTKDMRGHQCALHFDWKFVKSVMEEAIAKNAELEGNFYEE